MRTARLTNGALNDNTRERPRVVTRLPVSLVLSAMLVDIRATEDLTP
jgi:hypothetical protein